MPRLAPVAAGLLLVACGGVARTGASRDSGMPDASFDAGGADAGPRVKEAGTDALRHDADADADADAGTYTRPGPCREGARCSIDVLPGTPQSGTPLVECVCSQGRWSCRGTRLDALPAAYGEPQLPDGGFADGGSCQGVNLQCDLLGCLPVFCYCASDGTWHCHAAGPC